MKRDFGPETAEILAARQRVWEAMKRERFKGRLYEGLSDLDDDLAGWQYDHVREHRRGMRWIYTVATVGALVAAGSTVAVLWMLWELVQWVTSR